MGRTPCCSKVGLRRGVWTALEDKILTNYIKIHGEGRWRNVPKEAGLKRCGKSCRLRWINYLRPDIKRGNISPEEEDLILKLHGLLGNRWSLIAGRLPGRTDNEIKNYWNTNLRKKVIDIVGKQSEKTKDEEKPIDTLADQIPSSNVIRPKAFKFTKVLITTPQPYKAYSLNTDMVDAAEDSSMNQEYLVNNATLLMESKSSDLGADNSSNFSSVEFNVGELLASNNEYLSDQSDHFWEVSDQFDNAAEKNGKNIVGANNEPWPASWDLCNFENVIEEEGNNNGHGGVNDDSPPPSFDNYLLFLDEILQD